MRQVMQEQEHSYEGTFTTSEFHVTGDITVHSGNRRLRIASKLNDHLLGAHSLLVLIKTFLNALEAFPDNQWFWQAL